MVVERAGRASTARATTDFVIFLRFLTLVQSHFLGVVPHRSNISFQLFSLWLGCVYQAVLMLRVSSLGALLHDHCPTNKHKTINRDRYKRPSIDFPAFENIISISVVLGIHKPSTR